MARPYRTRADEQDVFRALASPLRRRMLMAAMGKHQSLDQLCELVQRSKTTIAAHLRILRDAGLITSVRQGASVSYHANHTPLRSGAKWLSAMAVGAVGAGDPAGSGARN